MGLRARMLAVGLALAGCGGADRVTLVVANGGADPLRCLVVFGHWVTADVPLIAPGATAEVALWRDAAERSLYVPRAADGRRMMVEGLACDRDGDWGGHLARVPLDAVRLGTEKHYVVACGVQGGGCLAPSAP